MTAKIRMTLKANLDVCCLLTILSPIKETFFFFTVSRSFIFLCFQIDSKKTSFRMQNPLKKEIIAMYLASGVER